MSQPKPASPSLTKKGLPRQRAPGAGRPDAGRKCRLSPVSQECRDQLDAIAAAIAKPGKTPSLAAAIEHAARVAHQKLKL